MRVVGAYQPAVTSTVTLSLLAQTGYTEVINDSNFAITINVAGGQVIQPPGIAQIYKTPSGGGAFTISTNYFDFTENTSLPGSDYLITDMGAAQLITVNQYQEEELIGRTYPYSLIRSVLPAINTNSFAQSSVEGTLSSTQSTSLSGPAGTTTGFVYLQGIDVSVDQESTAHSYTLTYGQFLTGGNFQVVFHSTTTGTFLYSKVFNPPIPSQLQGSAAIITASIAGVGGSTARGAINIWGAYQ